MIFLLSALTLYRILPFLIYSGIHFDSDQATFGLMAIHLSEWKAFPVFMYGQKYMLAVQTWLAFPLFLLFKPSIALLKAPAVFTNYLSVSALFWIAFRKLKFSAGQSFAICLPLALPSISLAQQWMNVSGGHIEPILYALAFFLLRERLFTLGFLSAIAVLHREYCAALVIAIWIIIYFENSGSFFTKLRNWLLTFLSTFLGVQVLARTVSSNFFGPSPPFKFNHGWDPYLESAQWIGRHLITVLGMRAEIDATLPISFSGGSGFSAIGISILFGLCLLLFVQKFRLAGNASTRVLFSIYLLLSSAFTCGFYLLKLQTHDAMMIRYLILPAFIPTALLVLVFSSPRAIYRQLGYLSIGLMAITNATDIGRYWHSLNSNPPIDRNQEIADFLTTQKITSGFAPYWDAYDIDFRTRERIPVASTGQIRIPEYQEFYATHSENSARIEVSECLAHEREFWVRTIRICVK